MRKFLVVLLLLILLAGALFYIGWMQYRIDRNEIGVVHTKTVGYLDAPVIPGEFYWTPWRLIPRNVTLITIPAAPNTLRISHKGTLPSGELYSYYLQGHPDFTYSLDMTVTFSIKSDHAVDLVKHEDLSTETYQAWLDRKRTTIRQRSMELLLGHIIASADALQAEDRADSFLDASTLRGDLEAHLPGITIQSLVIDSLTLPDLSLYVQARESYYRALTAQQQTLEDALEEFSTDRAELEMYLQKLEKYGRLFTQYPALLDYLELHSLDSLP